jgi:hypothetical protein
VSRTGASRVLVAVDGRFPVDAVGDRVSKAVVIYGSDRFAADAGRSPAAWSGFIISKP